MRTDEQLKQLLVKMLPEKITLCGDKIRWLSIMSSPQLVRDTELLQLCWEVEETLTPKQQVDYYNFRLRFTTNNGCVEEYKMIHASWEQRTIALAKVKGI